MNTQLQATILDILASGSRFAVGTGASFEAVTESDLVEALRSKGWRIPATGFFLSEVKQLGFTVKQAYTYSEAPHRVFKDGSKGRKLSKYNTLITL